MDCKGRCWSEPRNRLGLVSSGRVSTCEQFPMGALVNDKGKWKSLLEETTFGQRTVAG